MNAKQANNIPIGHYLEANGIRPAKTTRNYYMYTAPYRIDRDPSLKVSHRENLWIDYGDGTGGTLIDLVLKINPHLNISEAIKDISKTTNSFFSFHQQKVCCQSKIQCRKTSPEFGKSKVDSRQSRIETRQLSLETRNAKSALPVSKHAMPNMNFETPNAKCVFGNSKREIVKTYSGNTDNHNHEYLKRKTGAIISYNLNDIGSNPAIIGYLKQRGINPDTAIPFCKEIYYQINGKRFFGLANENNKGWSIRNKYWKGCTAQGYSYYPSESEELLVFEGIFDLLSYAELDPDEKNRSNFLVLNSLVNIKQTIPILTQYQTINLYLDHDRAGRKATRSIQQQFPVATDQSSFYKSFKDLNDYHLIKVKACLPKNEGRIKIINQ